MIKEDYVSFEVAKLLNEKGFDVETRGYYPIKGDATGRLFANSSSEYNHNHSQIQISAPTLQMAMKWLREVHNYYIQVMLDSWACGDHSGYYVVIQKTNSDFEMMLSDALDEVFYKTPEEALEAAIKYCLENLIIGTE